MVTGEKFGFTVVVDDAARFGSGKAIAGWASVRECPLSRGRMVGAS
jgi:hypothetical protein